MTEFCRVCLKEEKTKLLDRLPLCKKCYDFITNAIDNNEKAEEYTARYYTTVEKKGYAVLGNTIFPPGITPPTRS